MGCCGGSTPVMQPAPRVRSAQTVVGNSQRVLVSVKESVVVPRTLIMPGGQILTVVAGMERFCVTETQANQFILFLTVEGPCVN